MHTTGVLSLSLAAVLMPAVLRAQAHPHRSESMILFVFP